MAHALSEYFPRVREAIVALGSNFSARFLRSTCLQAPSEAFCQPTARQIGVKKRESICFSGFPADAVFADCSGSVSLLLVDPMGGDRIVRFVIPGELFGLHSLIPTPTRMFSAVSREKSRLCFVSRTSFDDFMCNDRDRMWQLLPLLNYLVHDDHLQKILISWLPARKRLRTAISRFRCTTDAVHSRGDVIMPIKQ